ncbi:MAG: transglutaminase TgpA family protein [Solimonas sp.]
MKKTHDLADYLPVATLLRLLAVLALVFAPHAARLPVWESACIAAMLLWRTWAARRQWRMPPRLLRAALVFAAVGAVYASYGRVTGQTAGTALLCLMAALKLVELRGRRDVMVMIFLMYFMLVTHFLYSQEIWTAAYLLVTCLAITASLIECQHLGQLPPRQTLRKAAVMVGQSLPLMLIIFILFPRIPGPLWGLPTDAGAARSGLTDSMAPGDIAALIQSNEVAFRVRFEGRAPPPAERYWRGPVLDRFDGRTWARGWGVARPLAADAVRYRGTALRYELTLEAGRMPWLLALELPQPVGLPPDAQLNENGELLAARPVIERMRYTLVSNTQFDLGPQLDERLRGRWTQLPKNFDPRSVALARGWKAQGLSDAAIVDTALAMIREQNFVYTLRPPALGRDSIDEFLFDTRRGFCEHYSSSFTFLMRAAGIPARVVTGYQGGTLNEPGGYYVVSQSDAHAWSEVWLDGRWKRIDPTAAIAPERIERGLDSAIGADEGLPDYLARRTAWRDALQVRWDWLNARWNGLVLGYGPELQEQFLRRFGIADMRSMILVLTGLVTGVMAIVGLLLLRRAAPARSNDAALREWQRLSRKLARRGMRQRSDEGPRDFVARVLQARPDWQAALQPAAELYLRSRYLDAPDAALLAALRRAVSAARF